MKPSRVKSSSKLPRGVENSTSEAELRVRSNKRKETDRGTCEPVQLKAARVGTSVRVRTPTCSSTAQRTPLDVTPCLPSQSPGFESSHPMGSSTGPSLFALDVTPCCLTPMSGDYPERMSRSCVKRARLEPADDEAFNVPSQLHAHAHVFNEVEANLAGSDGSSGESCSEDSDDEEAPSLARDSDDEDDVGDNGDEDEEDGAPSPPQERRSKKTSEAERRACL